MSRSRRSRPAVAAALTASALLCSCGTFTSIAHETSGDYVITGHRGSDGFVWTCSYDPATKTLTVKKNEPR